MAALLLSCLLSVGLSQEADGAAAVEEYIYNQLIAHSATVDVSSYHVSTKQIKDIYLSVYYSHPELFFCTNGYSYGYSGSTVTSVTPSYTMDKARQNAAMVEYKSMVKDIVAAMPSGLSEVDKVVWFHEYLLTGYTYDYSFTNYDSYSFLKHKTGVCEAYALTFMALLQDQGIECVYRYSNAANHAWIAVELDGEMYNVDPTWDDPSYHATDDSRKYTYLEGKHSYLLVSDAAMLAADGNNKRSDAACHGHSIQCDFPKYDKAFWKDAAGYMSYLGGKWYYVNSDVNGDTALVECSVSSGPIRTLSIFTEYWRPADRPGGHYNGTYAGIGVYNNKLYVTGPKGIYIYDFGSQGMQQVYSYTGTNQIYGAKILPGSKYMTIYIDDQPYTSTYTTEQVDLSRLTAVIPTPAPTVTPVPTPTAKPTAKPTAEPTAAPSAGPVATPTADPVSTPTATPADVPVSTSTAAPVASHVPTENPGVTATPVATVPPQVTVTPGATTQPESTTPAPTAAADSTATPAPTDEPAVDRPPAAGTPEPAEPTDRGDKEADAPGADNSTLIIVVVVIGVSVFAVAAVLVFVKSKGISRQK